MGPPRPYPDNEGPSRSERNGGGGRPQHGPDRDRDRDREREGLKPIIKSEDLVRMNKLMHEAPTYSWANADAQMDYSKKLNFSDDEDDEQPSHARHPGHGKHSHHPIKAIACAREDESE
jgi:hypothetical protein